MFKKGSFLYSIFFHKCPRCHESSMFVEENPYKISRLFEMNKTCPVCGQDPELGEIGFYWGAMYIGYALSVGLLLIMIAVAHFIFGLSVLHSIIVVSLIHLILIPYEFRTARMIWVNMFVKYNPNWKNEAPVWKD
ncbi:MAG: DUF983 domain-containing protein [Chitinophagales bacterium]